MKKNLPNSELLRKVLEGEISPEAIEDHDLQRILEETARLELPDSLSTKDAWSCFSATNLQESKEENKLDVTPLIKEKTRPLWAWGLSIAAAIGVLYFALPLLFNTTKTIDTLGAEQASLQLPDQSKVELNAVSHIEYKPSTWSSDRKLSLEGEAYFEVKKGSRFVVKTPWGDVQVLGTRFNVFARNESFEVSCFSGSVKVTTSDGLTKVLTPGQGFRYDRENSEPNIFSFEKNSHAQWHKGEFKFDNILLNHVIAVLERQFDLKIEHPDFGDRVYTGFFSNSHLQDALNEVCNPMSLKYEKVSNNHFKLSKLQ